MLRRFLLGIFLLGVSGITAELLLMGHYEDAYQKIPLAPGASAGGVLARIAFR